MARPNLWTAQEIQDLRENRMPAGRSYAACHTKAFKLGISFCPGGHPECVPKNLTEDVIQQILDHVKQFHNRTITAELFHVSRNYVYELCKKNGLEIAPRPHDRLGEHVEFEGHNFSWKKGSWIATSSKLRASGEYNLTKILWKKFHGVYPGPGYDVRYKDGNRYNLKKSNLVLVTKAQAQKIRMKDPAYKANAVANAYFGLLNNAISEILDPDKKKVRIQKAVESRRPKQHETAMKASETRRKKALERGYYFTPETLKRMSESHKGKTYNKRNKDENK